MRMESPGVVDRALVGKEASGGEGGEEKGTFVCFQRVWNPLIVLGGIGM